MRKKFSSLLQIRYVGAFGEPSVDRRQQFACIGTPALVLLQMSETGGSTQFKQLRLLAARDIDGLKQFFFGLNSAAFEASEQKLSLAAV